MPPFPRTSLIKKISASKITLLLIVSNIAVYLAAGFLDTRAFESLSHDSFLIDWGGNVPALTLSGEYWRLFTSMFLHVGFLHLAVNMLALWSLGMILEARMRPLVFLGVYMLAGLCGSLVTALWHRDELFLSCGASGAILGIFGAAILYGLHDRREGRPHIPPANLLFSLVLTFGAGFALDIDNAAHLGGLLAGALLAGIALWTERMRPMAAVAVLISTALIVGAALAGVTFHYHDRSMQEQIAAARFERTLASMGLLQPARALSGALSLDECAARALSEAAQSARAIPDLRRCAKLDNGYQRLLAEFMPQRYQRCLVQTAQLQQLYPDAATRKALAGIEQYCDMQTRIYAAIFQDQAVGLNVEKAQHARLLTRFLVDGGKNFRTDSAPLQAQTHALQALLRRPGELAFEIVRRSGCPYWSCAR
ncbi:rhomboid family intramembrane serine protease [Achromobacter insolitus]|uniref:rhomboid family intramembrane serine protease n=1 Tax=Achromobacter insolitus TaxID=217204 RepID=UPI0027E0E226|nr:rhomboid family intramembrane serine protease [Achromobacter insolitus]MDQ6213251.1 rhomboid family intramembrane serine protease [Achromobacter insolitus]